jgi:hypothetical protein
MAFAARLRNCLTGGYSGGSDDAIPEEIPPMRVKDVKKVVLAYSGGLDTSVILLVQSLVAKWSFTADPEGEELGPAPKAEMLGVKIFVDDLRALCARLVFRCSAPLYEGRPLGTSIARPLIAQRQIEIAEQVGADGGARQPARATTRCALSSAIMR